MARRNASFQQLFLESLQGFGDSALRAGQSIGQHNRAEAENTRAEAESKANLAHKAELTRGAKTEADTKAMDYDKMLRGETLRKALDGATATQSEVHEGRAIGPQVSNKGTEIPAGRAVDFQAAKKANKDTRQADMALFNFLNPDKQMTAGSLAMKREQDQGLEDLAAEDKAFGVEEKKAKATREAETHASAMETDKAQRRLLGAQAEKTTADASATSTKPPTESQSNSATFGRRLEQAIADMDEIKAGGHNPAGMGAGLNRTLSKLPGGNLVASDNTQRQRNAETNFLTAVLRKESGASISPTEFSTGEQLYFERTGDSEAVKAQKARNRQQALEGLKAGSGPAWETVTPVARPAAPAGNLADLSDDDLDAQLRAKGIDPMTGKRMSKGGASGSF